MSQDPADPPSPDPARLVFFGAATALALGAAFTVGALAARGEWLVFRAMVAARDAVMLIFEEANTITGLRPDHHLYARGYEGEGVTVNKTDDDALIAIQGLFGDVFEIRLIERDGALLNRWPVSFMDFLGDLDPPADPANTPWRPRPQTDWNTSYQGFGLARNGDALFNVALHGLVRVDRCGAPVWTRQGTYHHSIEPASEGGWWIGGGYWVPPEAPSPWPVYDAPLKIDEAWRVTDNGDIVERVDTLEVTLASGLDGLILQSGEPDAAKLNTRTHPTEAHEVFHLNDVEELSAELAPAFPMFEAGDLLMSLRNRNLIILTDAAGETVKWWAVGSWRAQHDPDFGADGRITLFDNHHDGTPDGSVGGGSRIVAIDPATMEEEVLVGHGRGVDFFSRYRGKHQVLPNGDVMVAETEGGRAFQVDRDGRMVWEYVNRWDEEETAILFEARAYPRDYFTVENWTCP